jgi:hypothetical protein
LVCAYPADVLGRHWCIPHQLKPHIISEAEGKTKRYAAIFSSADHYLMN